MPVVTDLWTTDTIDAQNADVSETNLNGVVLRQLRRVTLRSAKADLNISGPTNRLDGFVVAFDNLN